MYTHTHIDIYAHTYIHTQHNVHSTDIKLVFIVCQVAQVGLQCDQNHTRTHTHAYIHTNIHA